MALGHRFATRRSLSWDFSEVTVYPDRRNAVQVLVKAASGATSMRTSVAVSWSSSWTTTGASGRSRSICRGLRSRVCGRERGCPDRQPAGQRGAIDDDGSGEQVLKTSIAVRDAVLPSDLAEGLGESLDFLDIDASVVGSIPSERGTNEAITAWRDAGGTLEHQRLSRALGALGIESAGTIALDGAMRPIAALTANIIGYGDVIDALIMSNMIPLGDAFIAKVAFNMLAEKPEDGGPPVLRGVP